jgi:4-amino-4-deoxy-L-arabinose transferase-like glycosyltransferase
MIRVAVHTDFTTTLIRNSLVQILWWIVFFPGFFSGDSFGAIVIAKSGELTNDFTTSWAIYVWLFSLFGKAIGLLTLLNGLILIYSLTRFAYSVFSPPVAAIASFVLALTPMISGMGITLWHDILMTSGLLLLSTLFVEFQRTKVISRTNLFSLLIPGSVLITFRPNGLPTLFIFALFFLITCREKHGVKILFSCLAISSFVILSTSYLIVRESPIDGFYAQEWMRNDISCFANSLEGNGFVEKWIPDLGNTEIWKSSNACTFLNRAKLSYEQKVQSQDFVPMAWLKLIQENPAFVISTHLKRNSYLLPVPIYGIPKVPFLHSTIEFKDAEIEWAFPSIADRARVLIRIWNAFRGITAWAGFWTLALVLVAAIGKRKEFIVPALMSISLSAILFVVAPIPDGRYALFALVTGQIAVLGVILQWALSGSNRRPTD